MRLLIVEDDEALSRFLRRGLADMVESVNLAVDGESAIELFLEKDPSLVILSADLTGPDGFSVLEQLRQISPLCPVLMLSGRPEPETRIACLERGADDVVSKPFSLRELRARSKALLRRHDAAQLLLRQAVGSAEEPAGLRAEALEMQRLRRQVEVAGAAVHLTNREFSLLEQLLLASGAPVSRAALRSAVWQNKPLECNALEVHVAALRRKLIRTPGAPGIETVRGVGYRLASTTLVKEGQSCAARAGIGTEAGCWEQIG